VLGLPEGQAYAAAVMLHAAVGVIDFIIFITVQPLSATKQQEGGDQTMVPFGIQHFSSWHVRCLHTRQPFTKQGQDINQHGRNLVLSFRVPHHSLFTASRVPVRAKHKSPSWYRVCKHHKSHILQPWSGLSVLERAVGYAAAATLQVVVKPLACHARISTTT
jgi:hypothetical protein